MLPSTRAAMAAVRKEGSGQCMVVVLYRCVLSCRLDVEPDLSLRLIERVLAGKFGCKRRAVDAMQAMKIISPADWKK